MMVSPAVLGLSVFLINLPFGYWRSKTVRFSRGWMLAVHLPIPLILVLRTVSGIGLRYVPFLVVFFALGQFAGAIIGRHLRD